MAHSELAVWVLGLIACFCLHVSDASLCKPNSKFNYDCNTCSCSSTGREFSCTNIICAPIVYKDKYLIEQNEKGHTILIPKLKSFSNEKKPKNDDELSVNDRPVSGKFKRSFIKMASYRKKPVGNMIEQSDYDDYDYDDKNSPIPEDEEDNNSDYNASYEDIYDEYDNRDDDYVDDNVATFGKLKTRL